MQGKQTIMVAGPYSAATAEMRATNLQALNRAGAELARRGHIPLIGVNAALPVLEAAGLPVTDRLMMDISLALAARCDACLRTGRSPGADREAEAIRARGRPVYERVEDVPPVIPLAADARPILWFDDFRAGDRFETGTLTVDEAEVAAFASAYDPQPFHMDSEAGAKSMFGRMVASGWHTAGLTMRLIVTGGFRMGSGVIGVGADELRWKAVLPGDRLRVVGEVVEARASANRPDRGIVRVRYRTLNQNDEEAQHIVATHIVLKRPAAG